MKLTSVDLEQDEIAEINTADNLKIRFTNEDIRMSCNVPLVIKYDYIDFKNTDYNFRQQFTLEDTQKYFEMMNLICRSTINELLDRGDEIHFRGSSIKGNLKRALQKHLPDAVDAMPSFFHFGLYTNQNADRKTGVRSPRIYFFLGNNGFAYPVFFDPYHEINPI